jgi:LuxR family maltose regulon positive regulatory protein
VLRRRAADWYLRNSLPEEAVEYYIAARDVGTAGRLVEELMLPTYRAGRVTTLQRWFRWLEDQDGITGHPMTAVWASILAARSGRPVEADRWADVLDRWEHQAEAQPDSQVVAPAAQLLQGIAQVLDGDPGRGDVSFENAISIGDVGAPDVLAVALCERALLAMAHHDWSPAGDLAGRARAVLHRGGIEDSYVTPLVCAAQARVHMHRGDIAAARQQLVEAQRLRPVLCYAVPHIAVQARIELARVHLALADTAGARTLMREIDGVIKRRPDLGTLVATLRLCGSG